MTAITQEQRQAIQAAGWTEEEVSGFVHALASFRDGLPPRERDAFNQILATAGAAASEDDVQGHLVVIAIIQPLIGLLLPGDSNPNASSSFAGAKASATASVRL